MLLILTELALTIHLSVKFLLEQILSAKSVHTLTLQLAHRLLPVIFLASAVQPRHSLTLTMKFALPLLERSVFGTSLLGFAGFILLHVNPP